MIVGFVLAAFVLGFGSGGAGTRAITPVATIRTLPSPRSLVAAGGAVWYVTPTGVQRVDPAANKVSATVPSPPIAAPASLRARASLGGELRRERGAQDRSGHEQGRGDIKSGPNPAGVAATAAAVWVTNHRGGTVSRIDPITNTVVATVKVGRPGHPVRSRSPPRSVMSGGRLEHLGPRANRRSDKPGEGAGGIPIGCIAVRHDHRCRADALGLGLRRDADHHPGRSPNKQGRERCPSRRCQRRCRHPGREGMVWRRRRTDRIGLPMPPTARAPRVEETCADRGTHRPTRPPRSVRTPEGIRVGLAHRPNG